MKTKTRLGTGIALLCILLASAGCSAKSSTPATGPRVLLLAHVDADSSGDPAVAWFASELKTVSHGKLEVSTNWDCCGGTTTSEKNLVSGVKSGHFDLGWVGTRVFADLGIQSAQALTAPMLIDSYALEGSAVQGGIAKEALAGLGAAGVTPIGLEPGLLRRPIVSKAALVGVNDWQGITFDVFPSKANATAIAALGAKPVQLGFDERDAGISSGAIRGLENSLVFEQQEKTVPAPYITSNVVLWPRISALIANPKVLRGLTKQQRAWLTEASTAVRKRTPDLAKADADAAAALCSGAGHFATASDDQLAQLKTAFAPIYSQLNADPGTASLVALLDNQKKGVGKDPALPISQSCQS